jgi:hypothetical protein
MLKINMKQVKFINPEVAAVFASYPKECRNKLMFLRQLIFDVASKTKEVGEVEETLKWGEPSYVTTNGSTIRINWKEKLGKQYAIYFKCTSLLVPTFKKLYPTEFEYEDNRAIRFNLNDNISLENIKKLRHCIKIALTYHLIKNKLKEGDAYEV